MLINEYKLVKKNTIEGTHQDQKVTALDKGTKWNEFRFSRNFGNGCSCQITKIKEDQIATGKENFPEN